jgi:hypothetical protein
VIFERMLIERLQRHRRATIEQGTRSLRASSTTE